MKNELLDKEIERTVGFLRKLKPGKLPLPIFLELARLTVTPIVEIVPLRKTEEDTVEVLLIRREENDPNWPGMYHTPGTVVRASDKEGSYDDAIKRILKGELKGVETKQTIFVTNLLHRVKRGMESSLIYWVEVTGRASVGEFYNLDKLPDNIIDTQIGFIRMAAQDFLNNKV